MMRGAQFARKPRCEVCNRPLSQAADARDEWGPRADPTTTDGRIYAHYVDCAGKSLREIRELSRKRREGLSL
jgi:hypothetical protein